MGIGHSSLARDCLFAAVGNNSALLSFKDDPFFHAHIPLYNLNLPVVPAAITYPETSEQVADIVRCGAKYDYKVQAYSGGHSYGNYGIVAGLGGTDGAIVVHLKNFQHFSFDNKTKVATIGAGTKLGDLQTRLYNAGGRAIAHGSCPQVGTGGHLTIGGLGPMSRQWGPALDHVEEVEIVLANSSIVKASATQNQDLFFAAKGAAASFGIVTQFKIRTHLAPTQALQFSFTVNLGDTASKAHFFRDWQNMVSTNNLTRKFSSELVVFQGGILVSGTFFGSREQFEEFGLEHSFPIKNHDNVMYLTDWLGMVTSRAEDLIRDAVGGIACSFYAKSMSFTPDTLLPEDGINALFKYLDSTDKDTLVWFIIFDLEGGATNDVPMNATAYPHRDTIIWMQSYAVNPLGLVSPKTKDFLSGINNIIASFRPSVHFGSYPGYVDPLMPDPQRAYWGSNLPRLQQIKVSVDPTDLFHNPQSVQNVSSVA